MTAPEPNVRVTVSATMTSAPLATATSDAQGNYSLTVPTGGHPIALVEQLASTCCWTSWQLPDQPLDHDVTTRALIALFSLSGGPLWSAGSMGSVYSSGGVGRDAAKGTLNIAVLDCNGGMVVGATITVEPAPERLVYLDANGLPAPSQTKTVSPYTFAVAFNAPGGSTHISATVPGLTFDDATIDVTAGDVVTSAVLHAR